MSCWPQQFFCHLNIYKFRFTEIEVKYDISESIDLLLFEDLWKIKYLSILSKTLKVQKYKDLYLNAKCAATHIYAEPPGGKSKNMVQWALMQREETYSSEKSPRKSWR